MSRYIFSKNNRWYISEFFDPSDSKLQEKASYYTLTDDVTGPYYEVGTSDSASIGVSYVPVVEPVSVSLRAGVIVSDSGTLKVQPLSFDGTIPSDSGVLQGLSDSSLLIFETGHEEPDYGGSVVPGTSMDFYKCTYVSSDSSMTWSGRKAVLNNGIYSFQSNSIQGLVYNTIKPQVSHIYSQDTTVQSTWLYTGTLIPDQNTLYLAAASRGMTQLVSNTALQNTNNNTVISKGAFDFAASTAVLDFPIQSNNKWELNDFTMQVVCTPCVLTNSYTSIFSTGDDWQNGAALLRFGDTRHPNTLAFCWNGVDDFLVIGGNVSYNNTEFLHFAVSRSNNVLKLFINGQLIDSTQLNNTFNVASDNLIRLGALNMPDGKYWGKIKWARISNIARYTKNFEATNLIFSI